MGENIFSLPTAKQFLDPEPGPHQLEKWDPDPDPHQNVLDLPHWPELTGFKDRMFV